MWSAGGMGSKEELACSIDEQAQSPTSVDKQQLTDALRHGYFFVRLGLIDQRATWLGQKDKMPLCSCEEQNCSCVKKAEASSTEDSSQVPSDRCLEAGVGDEPLQSPETEVKMDPLMSDESLAQRRKSAGTLRKIFRLSRSNEFALDRGMEQADYRSLQVTTTRRNQPERPITQDPLPDIITSTSTDSSPTVQACHPATEICNRSLESLEQPEMCDSLEDSWQRDAGSGQAVNSWSQQEHPEYHTRKRVSFQDEGFGPETEAKSSMERSTFSDSGHERREGFRSSGYGTNESKGSTEKGSQDNEEHDDVFIDADNNDNSDCDKLTATSVSLEFLDSDRRMYVSDDLCVSKLPYVTKLEETDLPVGVMQYSPDVCNLYDSVYSINRLDSNVREKDIQEAYLRVLERHREKLALQMLEDLSPREISLHLGQLYSDSDNSLSTDLELMISNPSSSLDGYIHVSQQCKDPNEVQAYQGIAEGSLSENTRGKGLPGGASQPGHTGTQSTRSIYHASQGSVEYKTNSFGVLYDDDDEEAKEALLQCLQMAAQCGNPACINKFCLQGQAYLRHLEENLEQNRVWQSASCKQILRCLVDHSVDCPEYKCPMPWCSFISSMLSNDMDFEAVVARLWRHFFSGLLYQFTESDNGEESFCKLSASIQSAKLQEGVDWTATTHMGSYGNVVLAVPSCDHTCYWVIKKTDLRVPFTDKRWDILKQFQDLTHPHIIRPLWLLQQTDHLYWCTQYEGFSLKEALQSCEGGTLGYKETRQFLRQLLEAIKFLQARSLVYLLWTSCNIIICHNQVKLCNFGGLVDLQSFKNNDEDSLEDLMMCLPPCVVPPEVYAQKSLTAESEYWGLACLAYEMSFGSTVYYDFRHMPLFDLRMKIKDLQCCSVPSLTGCPVRPFIELCWQRDPSCRPSVQQLQKLLLPTS